MANSPYTVSTINGPTVLFKPYGVKLDIQPRVDSRGTVRAHINSEVSSIDAAISTPAGPGLRTRKTSTEFNVSSGETIVLSGLLSRETSTDIDKVPVLGDLPILGALFRLTRFQNKETELVVFVTPPVVDSHTPELAERVKRSEERLARTMDAQPYLSQPLQPGIDAGRFTPALSAPVAMAPPPAPSGGSLLVVVLPDALLRTGPQATAPVLLTLGRGAAVRMASQEENEADISRWRKVVVGEIVGWMAADALKPVGLAAGGMQGHGLLLTRCTSVHTAFMRQTIDVIYLDRHGCVIRCVSGLRPWRASAGWRAAHVLELAEGSIARYCIGPGNRLRHPDAPW